MIKVIKLISATIEFAGNPAKALLESPQLKKLLIQLGALPTNDIDARLGKIYTARENLIEALEAIDELQLQADFQKAEFERLRQAVEAASSQKVDIETSTEELSQLEGMRVDTIRKAFNLPTRKQIWIGYLISFVVGITTAFLASLGYEFAVKPAFLYFFPTLI